MSDEVDQKLGVAPSARALQLSLAIFHRVSPEFTPSPRTTLGAASHFFRIGTIHPHTTPEAVERAFGSADSAS
jgi:hypothetical protein